MISDWYPGNEYVDWIGMSYVNQSTDCVVEFARYSSKPVMITATSQDGDWDAWFAPFFKFVVDNNDVVRAVTYINTGKSQLSNADIIKSWKAETKQSFWLHGGPDLFGDLGW